MHVSLPAVYVHVSETEELMVASLKVDFLETAAFHAACLSPTSQAERKIIN